jgi:hypothetical protein
MYYGGKYWRHQRASPPTALKVFPSSSHVSLNFTRTLSVSRTLGPTGITGNRLGVVYCAYFARLVPPYARREDNTDGDLHSIAYLYRYSNRGRIIICLENVYVRLGFCAFHRVRQCEIEKRSLFQSITYYHRQCDPFFQR